MAQPSMRDAIIEAGEIEFHERGYAATGIAAITTRAAAHKGSFYNHFGSKEDLAIEVVRRYGTSQHIEMLIGDGDAIERIRTHFAFIAGELRKSEFRLGCLLGNLSAELTADTPKVREVVTGNMKYWSELLTAALEQAAEQNNLGPRDAESTAWMLIDAYEGAAVRARATLSPKPIETFTTLALPQILHSFVSGPTR